tara:strand:- start:23 stop:568 length:546 start_codon:yes stop_codon:yes gene_type:complete
MDKSLLAIREYFKNNNPGNVKLPFNQDGLSKEEIINKASELGYKQGKDYYLGDFAYRKYNSKNKGIIEMIEQAERYNTNNLNEIIENYAKPEIVDGEKRFPTKYNIYKEKFNKYGLNQNTIDFSDKKQVTAFAKAFVEVENQVTKDGSPTNWEKYYTDDVIDTAVNEYVTFKTDKKINSTR